MSFEIFELYYCIFWQKISATEILSCFEIQISNFDSKFSNFEKFSNLVDSTVNPDFFSIDRSKFSNFDSKFSNRKKKCFFRKLPLRLYRGVKKKKNNFCLFRFWNSDAEDSVYRTELCVFNRNFIRNLIEIQLITESD